MKKVTIGAVLTILTTLILSASGAVIGVRINDAVQDTKIDQLMKAFEKTDKKVDNIIEYLSRKSCNK